MPLDPSAARIARRAVPDGAPRREVAWALVRELAGVDVELSNPCPRCGGAHGPVRVDGPPMLAAVAYAVRRGSGETVAVAAVVDAAGVDSGAATLGIDAEFVVDAVRDAAGGVPDVRRWVRVEAALKADRRGLEVDPDAVVIRRGGHGWSATVPGSDHSVLGSDVLLGDDLLISVATATRAVPPAGRADAPHPATR